MVFLLNTDAPVADRRPSIDGQVSRRLFWVRNAEKLSWRDWAFELFIGPAQLLVAVGSAAELWVKRYNAKGQG